MILANLIQLTPIETFVFPPFFKPVAFLLLVAEYLAFRRLQGHLLSGWKLAGVVLFLNFFSCLCGLALFTLFPEGVFTDDLKNSPNSLLITFLSLWVNLVIPYLLSILFEYAAARLAFRRIPFVRLGRTLFITNGLSFLIINLRFCLCMPVL